VRVDACDHILSHQALNVIASRGLGSCGAYLVLKAPGHDCREPGRILSQGKRQFGLTGDEILPAHGYRDRKKYWCRLLLGLALFKLVVPPLQLEVMGPYPVRGT
jgi:hypothetical protein